VSSGSEGSNSSSSGGSEGGGNINSKIIELIALLGGILSQVVEAIGNLY
jgi:hypothetical protein